MGSTNSTPADGPQIPEEIKAPAPETIQQALAGDMGALTSTAGGDANPDVLNTSVLERIAKAANDLKGNGESPAFVGHEYFFLVVFFFF